jgi:Trk K+ transport system NAD-binding subunit
MNLSPTSGVARMQIPAHVAGQTIDQVEADRPDLSIVLIQRGSLLLPRPATDMILRDEDVVLVAGLDEAIDAFADN